MNRKDLISKVVAVLQDNGVSKKVSIPRQVFHISDDEGNRKDFAVRKSDKEVFFNYNDIASIVDACILVAEDAIKHGDEVCISGFGTLGLHHRAARKTKKVGTDEWVDVEARYVPKFVAGNHLKIAAKVYELSLSDTSNLEEDDK